MEWVEHPHDRPMCQWTHKGNTCPDEAFITLLDWNVGRAYHLCRAHGKKGIDKGLVTREYVTWKATIARDTYSQVREFQKEKDNNG